MDDAEKTEALAEIAKTLEQIKETLDWIYDVVCHW